MSEQIKPCPFCGGEAETYQVTGHTQNGRFRMRCLNKSCGIVFPNYSTSFIVKNDVINLWNTRPPLPDDVQCMIDAATICKTERHGCYGNNTECLFNRFDNGMGCLNNKHVTRLIEYITTGR